MCLIQINLFGQNKTKDNIYDAGILYINGIPKTELTKAGFTNSLMASCDTIYSFLTPTDSPLGVAWDGQYLWHSCSNNTKIYKSDTLGNLIGFINMPVSYSLSGLEYNYPFLYAVSEQMQSYYKINTSTQSYTTHSLPSMNPSDPNTWGISYGDGYLWVSEYGTPTTTPHSKIFKINPSTNSVIDTITVYYNAILGIKWIDNFIYGIDVSQKKLLKIDPTNGNILESTASCISKPYDLTVENEYLWIVSGKISSGGKQRIYKINSDIITSNSNFYNKKDENILFSVYPNPSKELITITVEQEIMSEVMYFDIINIEGVLVQSVKFMGQKTNVYVNDLKPGIYTVKMITKNSIIVKKIIKL